MNTTNVSAVDVSVKDIPEVCYIPLKFIIAEKSRLNVRKHNTDSPEFIKGIKSLAATIASQGLLMNLILHVETVVDDENYYGVAVGYRRRRALEVLLESGLITPEYMVKAIILNDTDALFASVTENNDREDMHPSDLIGAFTLFVERGFSVGDIALKFGYSSRYVNQMLRLSSMAPKLLEFLAVDKISVEQLQALAICDNHEKQVLAWNNCWNKDPSSLRRYILEDEKEVKKSDTFRFIGKEAYEKAGGEIRHDLFSIDQEDDGYIKDPLLMDSLAIEKLEKLALEIAEKEGWGWSIGQLRLEQYGDDKKRFDFPPRVNHDLIELSGSQENAVNKLTIKIDNAKNLLESHRQAEQRDHSKIRKLQSTLSDFIEKRNDIYTLASYTDEYRSERGVIAHLDYRGNVVYVRGLMKLSDKAKKDKKSVNVATDGTVTPVTQVSAALARSLSAERTLAVSSELTTHPLVALALMVHRIAITVFGGTNDSSPVSCQLQNRTSEMIRNAPGCEDSKAAQVLSEKRVCLETLLPQGWEDDFTLLTTLSLEELLDIQAYCVSTSLDGLVYQYIPGKKSKLQSLEQTLNFKATKYWKPTSTNFWKRLDKESMYDQLTQAGIEVNKDEFLALKKSDAAKRAEMLISDIEWVPEFF
ncbi:TPA_asm: ParB/RepB/Spo0J family partition protein [Salmonella enterica subsp. enterica serovar Thompson]|nr:ParB/RepB/Spo0J family partition protein [Salmonella enterica subsp. enterica serovar Thompson]HAE9013166.1 ParB/RepB/Spo0J family partition protein [Salmonella enterica subsp. enterica serovar Thompson]